jgi:colanic acid/amylovoran biosynthesis glycosyltransferase
MTNQDKQLHVAYVLENFPSPTEYFILNEILELQKRSVQLTVFVLRKQRRYLNLPELELIKSPVYYLPLFYHYFPFIIFFLFPISTILKWKYLFSKSNFLKNLRNFCYSIYFYKKMIWSANHIHGHFAFIAADIAELLSKISGVEFSISAHAQDIYSNQEKIKRILSKASFVITCTNYNKNFLNQITNQEFKNKIIQVYHGIESTKWTSKVQNSDKNATGIKVLSVSRLVEKKGLIYILKAVDAIIKGGYKISCTIIGEGPMKKNLLSFVEEQGIGQYVFIKDFTSQKEINKHMLDSDIFILPCTKADNGDMDGLPNVILEAMVVGIPVITTLISAIPEIVENRFNGILVNDGDYDSIAKAITEIKKNKELRDFIIENAREKIVQEFEINKCADKLAETFKQNVKYK